MDRGAGSEHGALRQRPRVIVDADFGRDRPQFHISTMVMYLSSNVREMSAFLI